MTRSAVTALFVCPDHLVLPQLRHNDNTAWSADVLDHYNTVATRYELLQALIPCTRHLQCKYIDAFDWGMLMRSMDKALGRNKYKASISVYH